MTDAPRYARPTRLLPLCSLLAMSGCADPTKYPSLAPRMIETMSLAEPARPAPPPGTAADAADAHYAPLVRQAQDGDAAFRRQLETARPVLSRERGATVGSEEWIAAQQQLTRLDAARGPVAQALLSLQAESESPETRADSGLAAAVRRALATVSAIDTAEGAALAGLTPIRS